MKQVSEIPENEEGSQAYQEAWGEPPGEEFRLGGKVVPDETHEDSHEDGAGGVGDTGKGSRAQHLPFGPFFRFADNDEGNPVVGDGGVEEA